MSEIKVVSAKDRRKFFTEVSSAYNFNAREGSALIEKFSENAFLRCYSRSEHIINSGDEQTYLYFLYSGLVRCCIYNVSQNKKKKKDEDGDSVTALTNRFMFMRGEPFIAAPSLKNHAQAIDSIEVLKNSEVVCVPLRVVEDLQAKYPDIVAALAKAIGESYIQMQNLSQIRQLSVEERCKWLHAKHPEMEKVIQKQYLASFLGMSKETYSRCMRKLMEENAI